MARHVLPISSSAASELWPDKDARATLALHFATPPPLQCRLLSRRASALSGSVIELLPTLTFRPGEVSASRQPYAQNTLSISARYYYCQLLVE